MLGTGPCHPTNASNCIIVPIMIYADQLCWYRDWMVWVFLPSLLVLSASYTLNWLLWDSGNKTLGIINHLLHWDLLKLYYLFKNVSASGIVEVETATLAGHIKKYTICNNKSQYRFIEINLKNNNWICIFRWRKILTKTIINTKTPYTLYDIYRRT